MAEINFLLNESSEDSKDSVELIVSKTKEETTAEGDEANVYYFDLDTMKDKPWLRPGADITDYFNYGFTESTWKKYCDMQRENRDFVARNEVKQEKSYKRYNDYSRNKHRF